MPYKNPADQAAAAHRHYEANKEVMKARAVAHRKRQRRENAASIRAAKNKPCTDCGIRYPYYVMQFDHVGGRKLFDIGTFTRKSIALSRLQDEIAKCEVVCANCHAERTYQRGQRFTLQIVPVSASNEDDPDTLF